LSNPRANTLLSPHPIGRPRSELEAFAWISNGGCALAGSVVRRSAAPADDVPRHLRDASRHPASASARGLTPPGSPA